MENKEKVFAEVEAELNEIFAEMDMDNQRYRQGASMLKELILVAVRYPENWAKGSYEVFGRRYNITRERIRQILWRTAAESWNIKYWKGLCERFGHNIELKFEIISKPNTEEFVTLFADNLREKYQIQPEEGEFDWSQISEEEKAILGYDETQENPIFEDEDFITVDSDENFEF